MVPFGILAVCVCGTEHMSIARKVRWHPSWATQIAQTFAPVITPVATVRAQYNMYINSVLFIVYLRVHTHTYTLTQTLVRACFGSVKAGKKNRPHRRMWGHVNSCYGPYVCRFLGARTLTRGHEGERIRSRLAGVHCVYRFGHAYIPEIYVRRVQTNLSRLWRWRVCVCKTTMVPTLETLHSGRSQNEYIIYNTGWSMYVCLGVCVRVIFHRLSVHH